MKYCNCCKQTLELSSFSKDKTKPDNLKIYCRSCSNAKKKAWSIKNKEKVQAYDKEWQASNKHKKNANYKKWQQTNKEEVNTYNSYRRALKYNATPAWANQEKIKAFYTVAKFFTDLSGGYVQHHVDHIVPLRGKNVCGLHVENNLQVLMAQDNLKKGNKHNGTI